MGGGRGREKGGVYKGAVHEHCSYKCTCTLYMYMYMTCTPMCVYMYICT